MNRGGRGRPTFDSPYAQGGSWSTPNSFGGGRGGGGGYQQNHAPRGDTNNWKPRGGGGNNWTSRGGGGGNNWKPRGGGGNNWGPRGGRGGWRGNNHQHHNSNRGGGWNKNADSSKTPAQSYVMPQMSQNPWQKLEEQYKADFGEKLIE